MYFSHLAQYNMSSSIDHYYIPFYTRIRGGGGGQSALLAEVLAALLEVCVSIIISKDKIERIIAHWTCVAL